MESIAISSSPSFVTPSPFQIFLYEWIDSNEVGLCSLSPVFLLFSTSTYWQLFVHDNIRMNRVERPVDASSMCLNFDHFV